MGKDLKGNPLPPGIMQRKSGIYRGRFYYKGETYTKDNADLKKLVQEMEDLRYEVKHLTDLSMRLLPFRYTPLPVLM